LIGRQRTHRCVSTKTCKATCLSFVPLKTEWLEHTCVCFSALSVYQTHDISRTLHIIYPYTACTAIVLAHVCVGKRTDWGETNTSHMDI